MPQVVNMRQVLKARARAEAEKKADEARVKHGAPKAEKKKAAAEKEKAKKDLDSKKLDKKKK